MSALKKDMAGMTPMQRRLVACYGGNLKVAAKRAGCGYTYARKCATKPWFKEALAARRAEEARAAGSGHIAGMLGDMPAMPKGRVGWRECLEQWCFSAMIDTTLPPSAQLKAAELLGKISGIFKAPERQQSTFPLIMVRDEAELASVFRRLEAEGVLEKRKDVSC